jgi:hypothetical protein
VARGIFELVVLLGMPELAASFCARVKVVGAWVFESATP